MKKRSVKIAVITAGVCMTLMLGACAGKSGAGTASGVKENGSAGEAGSGNEAEKDGKPVRNLTAEELQEFQDYVNEGDNHGNYGFLLSVYDKPADILLNEVFYTGAGLDKEPMKKEEKQAYLQAVGRDEIYTDITHLTTAQMDDFLQKKTGLTYREMNRPLSWTYLENYDTYYNEHGDTNYRTFTCVEGTTSDEKTFTLHFRPDGADGSEPSDGYYVTDCETVLEKSEDGYRFVSNRMMNEKGQIKDQTFEVELEPWGKVTFASYEPDVERDQSCDVTFSIIRDGMRVINLPEMRPENKLAAAEYFDSVAAVSFPDYNGDGYNDVIAILNYSYVQGPDAGTGFTEVRVYEGQKEEYFTLNRELSNTLTAMDGQKTIAGVLELIKNQGTGSSANGNDKKAEEPWRQAYIDYLKKDCETDANAGYALIYLDDDDIPELVEIGDCEATGCRITSYANGKVFTSQLNRLYFSYLEKQNLLCNSEGNMDCYYDLVYRMRNGQLELVAEGDYGAEDNSHVQFDENGEPIYKYYWEGKEVTEEAYQKKLNEVYDTSKAKPGYDVYNCYNDVEELLPYLRGELDETAPVYYGNWQITSYKIPGIAAMTDADAQWYLDWKFYYGTDKITAGERTYEKPVYHEQKMTAQEFAAEYNQTVTLDDLYIWADEITKVTVEKEDGIGSTIYVVGRSRMWIPWDGAFFQLTRQ